MGCLSSSDAHKSFPFQLFADFLKLSTAVVMDDTISSFKFFDGSQWQSYPPGTAALCVLQELLHLNERLRLRSGGPEPTSREVTETDVRKLVPDYGASFLVPGHNSLVRF